MFDNEAKAEAQAKALEAEADALLSAANAAFQTLLAARQAKLDEARAVRQAAYDASRDHAATQRAFAKTNHTAGGSVIGDPNGKYPNGIPYGTTHDMDCPGCAGTSFTASPRSETYWAS